MWFVSNKLQFSTGKNVCSLLVAVGNAELFVFKRAKMAVTEKTVNRTSDQALGIHKIIERGLHKHKQRKPLAGPTM